MRLLGIFFNRVSAGFSAEDEPELTLHEARALGVLSRIGATKLSQFACALGLHVSTASRTIDRLVKKGLVTRTSADGDRRCVVIALSERAEARERCLLKHRAARARDMLDHLDEADRSRLLATLEQLVPACAALSNPAEALDKEAPYDSI